MEHIAARVVLMTAPDRETAERIVTELVEARLIACGNIVPGLRSIYRWQGEIQREEEALVIMKTTSERVERMLERASELHPYDVPELLVLPVAAGHAPYMAWVAECVSE